MDASKLFRTAACVLAMAAAPGIVGCGSSTPVTPVSGQVTLDGQPAANVRVAFQPLGSKENPNIGQGSYGVTDDSGRFELTQIGTGRKGAVVGKHHVQIKSSNGPNEEFPDAPPKPKKAIPKEYNRLSKLEFEVKPGVLNTANFEINSAKGLQPARPSH